jgi:hypothetical protein
MAEVTELLQQWTEAERTTDRPDEVRALRTCRRRPALPLRHCRPSRCVFDGARRGRQGPRSPRGARSRGFSNEAEDHVPDASTEDETCLRRASLWRTT